MRCKVETEDEEAEDEEEDEEENGAAIFWLFLL
jgi:hypothetical protein